MINKVAAVLCTLLSVFGATPSFSQTWQSLRPEAGVGGGICTHAGSETVCLSFQCHATRGLELQLYRTAMSEITPDAAAIRVDNGPLRIVNFRKIDGVQGLVSNLDLGGAGGRLLLEMPKGTQISVQMEQRFSFSLAGVRSGIDQAIAQCASREYSVLKTFADLEKIVSRRAKRDETQTFLTYLNKTDSWGQDIASGLTNPVLRGGTETDCIALCLARQACKLVSYDDQGRLCSLKSGVGVLRRTASVTTTIISQRPEGNRRVLVPGPGPLLMTNLRATAGEPWQTYVARLRTASVGLGGDCQQEANEVGRIVSGLQLNTPAPNGQAGQPSRLSWSAEVMTTRVPAWLVVSVDKPARFAGQGFYAINAGGIGPFGVEPDAGLQRAFVPLFEGDQVRNGGLDIIPLEAGPLTVRITALGYLRACQQEMPFAQSEFQIVVKPAAPKIVLRDLTAAHPYDQRIDVAQFSRRVVFNQTRFQIQNLSDGSEILSREGKNLTLSPTQRFVVVFDNGQFEIIDIVDGSSLAKVSGVKLSFWNADSFFVSQADSKGRVALGETLRPSVFVNYYQTGPACCSNNGDTHISVSLENNILRIEDKVWGKDTAVWSLLDGAKLGVMGPIQYVPERKHLLGQSFFRDASEIYGFVAPMDVGEKWDMPLGPWFVHGYQFDKVRAAKNAEDNIILSMSQMTVQPEVNPDFGKSQDRIGLAPSAPTVLRGRGAVVRDLPQAGFQAAMRRWGVAFAGVQVPLTWLDKTIQETLLPDATPDPQFVATINRIERDLANVGIRANWSFQDFDQRITTYCEHFPSGDITETPPTAAFELNLAHRFVFLDRVVWVTRARCDGGATASSILHSTALSVFDSSFRGETLGSYFVQGGGSFAGSRVQSILDSGFDAKIFAEKILVTYAPGEGMLMVFDLSTRRFLMQLEYAQRGDLMTDVFVDAALEHVIQLNLDGSFAIYRLLDEALVLEGRYLDDELVVWTDDFRFDATEEGASFVELRFPGRPGQFSFQQFGGTLREQGLIRRILAGKPAQADIAVPGVPPELSGRLGLEAGQISGLLQVQTSRPLRAVRLFQDGLLTDSFTPNAQGVILVRAKRQKGVRWASVLAEDSAGLVSLPISVDLRVDPNGLADTYFLGVGIDYYKDARLGGLNYAKIDALRLSDAFAALDGRSVALKANEVLTDRHAGRDDILSEIDRLIDQSKAGDNLVLFFAGHGLQDDKGEFYLGLSSTDLDDLAGTALKWSQVAKRIAGAGVRITVLMDACHSGAAESGAFATNDGAVQGLNSSLTDAVTILSAAKGRQFSGESAAVGGGYFTSAILDVLRDRQTIYDQNKNGVLEVIELYRGVKQLVVAQRGSAQTPWLSRNNLIGEHGLF